MEIDAISGLIGTLGFPIACVVAMFIMWNKERDDHKNEMSRMTDAVNNNTTALEKLMILVQKIGGHDS